MFIFRTEESQLDYLSKTDIAQLWGKNQCNSKLYDAIPAQKFNCIQKKSAKEDKKGGFQIGEVQNVEVLQNFLITGEHSYL